MTPSYGPVDMKAFVRRTTEASGVPYHVEDERALARLAAAFAPRHNAKKPSLVTTAPSSPKGENE